MQTKVVEVEGFRIHTRYDRSYQDCNVVNEVIRSDCYKLSLLSVVINPSVILDIGGHIGTFGMLAKKYWPNARLIALEPNTVSYKLYCLNMSQNYPSCRDITVINAAIGYDSSKVVLLDGPNATGGGMVVSKKKAKLLEKSSPYRVFHEKVDLITLESIVSQFNLQSIGLVKWDCEGGEVDAFTFMDDKTAKLINCMVGEYHIPGGASEITKLITKRFSHLKVVAKGTRNIGPFWAFPKDIAISV